MSVVAISGVPAFVSFKLQHFIQTPFYVLNVLILCFILVESQAFGVYGGKSR